MRTVRSAVSWPSPGRANWLLPRSSTRKAKRRRKRVRGRSSAGGRRDVLPRPLLEKPTRESGVDEGALCLSSSHHEKAGNASSPVGTRGPCACPGGGYLLWWGDSQNLPESRGA